MTNHIYFDIGLSLSMFIWLIYFIQLINLAYCWIDDQELKLLWWHKFFAEVKNKNCPPVGVLLFTIHVVGGFVNILIWPVSLIAGLLFSLRYFVRLKKDVNKMRKT